jgi:hypothetical protein
VAKKRPTSPVKPIQTAPIPYAPTRVKGCPDGPGDYRLKVHDSLGEGATLPIVHTVDRVDETYLYGRPAGFFGMSGFKIERSTVDWHEHLA